MTFFRPILTALNEAKVEYVIVGGVAVVLHGYLRTTSDLDLIIRLTPGNVSAAAGALKLIGWNPRVPVDPRLLADKAVRKQWVEEKGMVVFSFVDSKPPFTIVDIFIEEPIDFDQLLSRVKNVDLGGLGAPVCSLDDLLQLKKDAGRPLDLIDIEHLEQLRDQGND